jgi:hypothetical protein
MKTNRYIPILRWKAGERGALQELTAPGRVKVTPLIIIGAAQYGDTKPPREKPLKRQPKSPPPPAAEEFANQVTRAWGDDPIFIDASALPSASTTVHHLDNIAAAGRVAALKLIPATTLKVPVDYQAAVKRMAAIDKRGVALRIDLTEASTAAT